MNECCAVVDLRQYTLHPGQRDTLIELFDTLKGWGALLSGGPAEDDA